jgi:hypothetical protein
MRQLVVDGGPLLEAWFQVAVQVWIGREFHCRPRIAAGVFCGRKRSIDSCRRRKFRGDVMKGNKLIAAIGAVVLVGAAASAQAGQQTGKITKLSTRASDGLIVVELDGSASGRPACATYGYWLIKNENSEIGKRQFVQLMSAKASNTIVKLIGSNTCTRWSDGEDIEVVEL